MRSKAQKAKRGQERLCDRRRAEARRLHVFRILRAASGPRAAGLVAIAGIHAFARVRPAVGLAFLAGGLIVRIAIALRALAFAFMRIVRDVVAALGLSGMVLWEGERQRQQGSEQQHSHRGVLLIESLSEGKLETAAQAFPAVVFRRARRNAFALPS